MLALAPAPATTTRASTPLPPLDTPSGALTPRGHALALLLRLSATLAALDAADRAYLAPYLAELTQDALSAP